MNPMCKSLKVTVGALAIVSAALGLTACGGHGGGMRSRLELMSPMPGSSSVQFDGGNALN
jgi:hypothetical protein